MKNEYTIKAGDNQYKISLNNTSGTEGDLNGEFFSLDLTKTKTGYHVLRNNKGYAVDVLNVDPGSKTVELRINHKYYKFQVNDKYDELLEKLGMDRHAGSKVAEIKAPMPGLVLDVLVNAGDEIAINQPLVILEAMKMENVLKSPTDGSIKKVEINKGDSVEKNQLLITFN